MSGKSFRANSWFNKKVFKETKEPCSQNRPVGNSQESHFSPSSFFTPDWNGDSINSSQIRQIKQAIHQLLDDAHSQFSCFYRLNRSLKEVIYNDFLQYTNSVAAVCHEITDSPSFWQHVQQKNSPYKSTIDNFVDIYCFRVITVFIYKILFISKLSKEISVNPNINNFLNPSSFLAKIFKTGSSTELLCEALQANQYTWYRPDAKHKEVIQLLVGNFHFISLTEMIKICKYSPKNKQSPEESSLKNSGYSHALSHRSFGLFVNNLLIKLPQWQARQENSPHTDLPNFLPGASCEVPHIINCKFVGDNLTSFSMSHWLAQEHEINKKWTEILCPDFVGDDFTTGRFVRICHELQFLCTLVRVAMKQNHNPVSLICRVMKEKYALTTTQSQGQISMFPQYEIKSNLLYDRIVFNLAKLPQTNSHHYLLSQISTQLKSLKDKGYLYVFTNQNLFVPSKSNQIKQLLKKVRFEAHYSFENLQGRGKIPSYLYVFSQKSNHFSDEYSFPPIPNFNLQQNYMQQNEKNSCLSFRLNGELNIFGKFIEFVKLFEDLYTTKNSLSTPLLRKELDGNLSFEFHQDAILHGKLLHSTSQDPSKITHPSFFNNLTKNCIPLNHYFQIKPIQSKSNEAKQKEELTSSLLGIPFLPEHKYPIILIVNQSEPTNIRLELINADIYRAKLEKYGNACFQYFGLIPKVPKLNLNIFKEFFNTSIGSQVIQLSLSAGTTKLKSKLESLLIPKFFSLTHTIPKHIEQNLQVLKISPNDFQTISPQEINSNFSNINSLIVSLAKKNPWQIMGLLAHFKYALKEASKYQSVEQQGIDFNNPRVVNLLLTLKTAPIFPNNPEIYVEVACSNHNAINLPLTSATLGKKDDNHFLELSSENMTIIRIYSKPTVLEFINHILSSAYGTPTAQILQALRVPTAKDIDEITGRIAETNQIFKNLLEKTSSLISQIITTQISGS